GGATASGGDVRAGYAFAAGGPYIVALPPGAVTPAPDDPAASPPPVRIVATDLAGVDERVTVVQPASASGPRLEDARIVVAGGRGLGAAENFRLVERLAAALGGLAAASRGVGGGGWAGATPPVRHHRQVAKPH